MSAAGIANDIVGVFRPNALASIIPILIKYCIWEFFEYQAKKPSVNSPIDQYITARSIKRDGGSNSHEASIEIRNRIMSQEITNDNF